MGIVEDFLKRGILVSPEVASRIDPREVEMLTERLGGREAVLTEDLYSLYRVGGPRVVSEYRKEDETKRINAFVDFYNSRFEFLRGVLVEKTDQERVISVNKLSSGEATVIGMVREIRKDGFTLEDQTGSVFCRTDSRVIEDEVVAVKGRLDRNVLLAERVSHPDIPLSRKVNLTERDIHVLFTGKLTSRASRRDYTFAFGVDEQADDGSRWLITKRGSAQKGGPRLLLNLPATVDVEGIRVMFFQYEGLDEMKRKFGTEDEKRLATELLKRRHMLPFVYRDGDPYLLREIPDIIFFTGGSETFFLNYKGVSVVSVVGEDGFVVNLKTRDFQKVEL